MGFFWRTEHFQALFPLIPLLFLFASKSPLNFAASLNEMGWMMPSGPAGLHWEGEAAVRLRGLEKLVGVCMNVLQK